MIGKAVVYYKKYVMLSRNFVKITKKCKLKKIAVKSCKNLEILFVSERI